MAPGWLWSRTRPTRWPATSTRWGGSFYYNASTQLCVPNALSQPGGYALGAQAGEAAIRQVTAEAGFTRFRRAAETPFNLVYGSPEVTARFVLGARHRSPERICHVKRG